MSRKVFLFVLAAIMLMSFAVFSFAADEQKKAEPIKVLFEVGGPVHNSKELPELMKNFLEKDKEFAVTITQDRDQFKADNIKKYDLVMIYTTSGDLTKDQEQGLVGFVQNGGGVVAIHSATDSFHNSDAYWKLVGGKFTGHEYMKFKVKITGKSHSIVQGMQDFEITDETYHHAFHPDSKIIVLMRRENDGEPSAWVQYEGQGRVFTTGLGHGEEAWKNPAFQNLIKRALEWADKKLNP